MWPLVIVPGQPSGQVGGAAIRRRERDGIGPFAQQGLDEALGLAIGLRRVGSGADVPDAQHPQHLAEQPGDVAGPIVGHHPLDPDAARPEPAQGANEEACRRSPPLIRQHFHIGKTGGVIDGHMQEVVAHAFTRPAPVAGDAVADTREAGELLDVEMDQFARPLALIASDRLLGHQRGKASEPHSRQPSGHRGAGKAQPDGDLLAAQPILPTQASCHCPPEPASLIVSGVRAGRAVLKARRPLGPPAGEPLAGRPFADPEAGRHFGDWPAFLDDPPNHLGSTKRRRSRILVRVVHPRALWSVVSQQPPSGSHGR